MRHTLTAVFDNRGEAQHSLNGLLAVQATGKQLHAFGMSAGKLFGRLFGSVSDDHPASDSGTEIKHATKIVERLVPVDDEEIYAGLPPGAPGATNATCRRGTEPGALQNYAHANSHYFGTRDSDNAFPLGTTFKANPLSATNWASMGDGVPDIGPLPAQDLPPQSGNGESTAYRHGNGIRISDNVLYRRWKAATAAQKAKWASAHPGELPPWGKFKDAVLHGWGRISLGSDDPEYAAPRYSGSRLE